MENNEQSLEKAALDYANEFIKSKTAKEWDGIWMTEVFKYIVRSSFNYHLHSEKIKILLETVYTQGRIDQIDKISGYEAFEEWYNKNINQ